MIDFGVRLKELRKNAQMNQTDVAKAIGVAQTAIANYESGARFPSEDKLIRLAELFGISVDLLLGRGQFFGKDQLVEKYMCSTQDAKFYIQLADDVIGLLTEGKQREVMGMILSLHQQGIFIHDVYHKVFQYILYKTGWLWESGVIDVAQEHYISQTIEQLMPLLMQQASKKRVNGKKVVCFTPEGEDHTLANHMISDYLELEGFNVQFLGRSIPTAEINHYLIKEKPDALVISITLEKNLAVLEDLITTLKKNKALENCKIIIGGQPLKKDKTVKGVDAIGTSLEDTVKKVKVHVGLTEANNERT